MLTFVWKLMLPTMKILPIDWSQEVAVKIAVFFAALDALVVTISLCLVCMREHVVMQVASCGVHLIITMVAMILPLQESLWL